MKALLFTGLLMLATIGSQAQVKTPQPSPGSEITQTIGLSEVSVKYSRPSMKGRTIFGGLVKYGEMWRTGANANTIVTFGDDVTIEGQKLAKGEYALFTKPSQETWEVYFYISTDNWGTPEKWDEEKVALKLMAKPSKMSDAMETMSIYFDALRNNKGEMVIAWEKTKLSLTVGVPTNRLTEESIATTLAGPTMNDYRNSARYYREEGKDLAQAKEWIEKSLELGGDDKFWIVREHALILADMKDYKGAIEAAKKSLALAEREKYQAYIDSNKKSIEEWAKM